MDYSMIRLSYNKDVIIIITLLKYIKVIQFVTFYN